MSRIHTLAEKTTKWLWSATEPGGTSGVVGALCLVIGITVILEVLKRLVELPPIIITYLIPVLIAAIRWGYLSAIVATITGAGSAAFFFYRPLYTLYVEDPARRPAENSRRRRRRHRSRPADARVGRGDPLAHRSGALRRGLDARADRAGARDHRGAHARRVGALPRRADRIGLARAAHPARVDPRGRDGAVQRVGGRRRAAPRCARQRGARRIGAPQQ